MQQRTGFRPGGRRGAANSDVPVLYYAFDLLYLDGYDLRKRSARRAQEKISSRLIVPGDALRYSDHYEQQGKALFEMSRDKKASKASSPKSATALIRNVAAASG